MKEIKYKGYSIYYKQTDDGIKYRLFYNNETGFYYKSFIDCMNIIDKFIYHLNHRECPQCKKIMRSDIYAYAKGYMAFNLDKRRRVLVCSHECKDAYESKWFVEEYKGNKIYCCDGKYVPYINAIYYFATLEDCKKRIDATNTSYFPNVLLGLTK